MIRLRPYKETLFTDSQLGQKVIHHWIALYQWIIIAYVLRAPGEQNFWLRPSEHQYPLYMVYQTRTIFSDSRARFFSSKKDSSRGNFYRGIDCAYSQSVKMASWPWFREGGRYIEEKNEKLRVLMDNHRFWGNLWWEIECAHSRVMEMLSWPWFRDAERCTISLYNIKLIPSRTIKVSICIFKGSVTFIA